MDKEDCGKIKFDVLCAILEKCSSHKGKQAKMQILIDFMKKLRPLAKIQHSNFYQFVRLLVPSVDRRSFGIGQKTLGRLIITTLGLNLKNSEDAKALMSNGNESHLIKGSSSDFVELAALIMSRRLSMISGHVLIERVNEFLNDISTSSDKSSDFSQLLNMPLKLVHIKWLFRIILKEVDVGVGLSDPSLLRCIHPDIEKVLKTKASLQHAIEVVFCSGNDEAKDKIQLFLPLRPMLSQRLNGKDLESKLAEYGAKPLIIQLKLDGERVQVHYKGKKIMYISRGGFDYTESYTSSMNHDWMAAVVPTAVDFILDGEMMIFDKSCNKLLSKGSCVLDVKNLSKSSNYQPRFCAFDIIYLNGRNLCYLPFIQRSKILKETICSYQSIYVLPDIAIVENDTTGVDKIRSILNEKTNEKEEGIILKVSDSAYVPNGRERCGWFKLKPDYVEGLADDLDLLVVGANYGAKRGRNTGTFHSFGVAIKDDEKSLFRLIGHVSSGFSNADIEQLKENVFTAEKVCRDVPGHWLVLDRQSERCDIYACEPQDCKVGTIRSAEVSLDGAGRFGLRFPRLIILRTKDEKNYEGVCSQLEMSRIARPLTGCGEQPKKREIGKRRLNHQVRGEKQKLEFRNSPVFEAKSSQSDVLSEKKSCFSGKEICIMIKDDIESRYIESLISEHGGQCVRLPRQGETWVVVVDNSTFSSRLGVRSKRILRDFRVVSTDWIRRYVEGEVNDDADWISKHRMCTRINILKRELSLIASSTNVDYDFIKRIKIDCGVFRGMRFASSSVGLKPWMIEVKLNGGVVVTDEAKATHIVLDDDEVYSNLRDNQTSVTSKWIMELTGNGCYS